MADTLNVAGMHIPKPVAIIGGGAIVIGGAVYYRGKKAASDANAAAATAGANTGIDPSTGYPYGSAEDASAMAAQGSYINPAQSGVGDPFAIQGFNSYGISSGGPPFTSNALWSQYVEQWLVGTMNSDPNTVGNAIGKYISGQPLDSGMVAIVQEAIAFAGYPPVSGPGGNPPSYTTATTTTTNPPPTGGGTGSGGGTTSHAPGTPSGLHRTNVTRTSIGINWNAVSGASHYVIRVTYQNQLIKEQTSNSSTATVSGLSANRTYGIHVIAVNSANQWSPEASITQKTAS
jgi:hypothetical protein